MSLQDSRLQIDKATMDKVSRWVDSQKPYRENTGKKSFKSPRAYIGKKVMIKSGPYRGKTSEVTDAWEVGTGNVALQVRFVSGPIMANMVEIVR